MNLKILIVFMFAGFSITTFSQKNPCSQKEFRQFDFWVGEWNVYGKNKSLAGNSKISHILDSCVILEEWVGATPQNSLIYKGKSFNSYNSASKQWQQTWVDNTGNTTEFLRGEATNNSIIYFADKVANGANKSFMRKLTFTKLEEDKVRQLGERSDDEGKTWTVEYDLEYRRKKN